MQEVQEFEDSEEGSGGSDIARREWRKRRQRRRRQLLALVAVVLVVGVKFGPLIRRMRREARQRSISSSVVETDRGRLVVARAHGSEASASGLRIIQVDSGSLWFADGLRDGDIVELMGTERVTSAIALKRLLGSNLPLKLVVERDGKTLVLEIARQAS